MGICAEDKACNPDPRAVGEDFRPSIVISPSSVSESPGTGSPRTMSKSVERDEQSGRFKSVSLSSNGAGAAVTREEDTS